MSKKHKRKIEQQKEEFTEASAEQPILENDERAPEDQPVQDKPKRNYRKSQKVDSPCLCCKARGDETPKPLIRGLCERHYASIAKLVRANKTTWKELELKGKATPTPTGSEAQNWALAP